MPVYRDDAFDEISEGIREAFGEGLVDLGHAELRHIDRMWGAGRNARGQPWVPLAPETIAQTGPDILEDEGDMRSSGYVERRDLLHIVLGFDDWKLGIHEHGTETIPARPIIRPEMTRLRNGRFEAAMADHIRAYLNNLKLDLALGGL